MLVVTRSPERSAALDEIERLAHWLDSRFVVPGTNIRFGVDSLLGLIPGVGDSISALIGVYLIWRAHTCGASGLLVTRMSANLLIDTLLGSIPVLGDVFDVAFKANQKNAALLLKHLNRA